MTVQPLIGRPRGSESDRRAATFRRLIDSGVAFDDAAREAKISPWRALAILDLLVRPILAKAA
jgi:hypothetical protein